MTVSLDVHTTSTIDSGSLKPVQTLNTDGTTVVDSTKDLGNGDRRSTTEFLTKINHTLILPVQGRTKDNWRNSRENWDTQPHVTGVGEGSNRVQIEVGDNIGLQRVEGKVTTVDDGARGNGHRSSQTIGGRHVESTIVVEVASKNSEHVVHNGEVHSRIDIKLANFQVDGRHQDGVFSDGQGPSLLEKKGRSSDGQKKFHWIKANEKGDKNEDKNRGFLPQFKYPRHHGRPAGHNHKGDSTREAFQRKPPQRQLSGKFIYGNALDTLVDKNGVAANLWAAARCMRV